MRLIDYVSKTTAGDHTVNSTNAARITCIFMLSLTLIACGGGGGESTPNGGESASAPPPPPQPAIDWDCSGYTTSVSETGKNSVVLMNLPTGASRPSNISENLLQEWTACVGRAGQIQGLYEHIIFVNLENLQPADASYSGRSFLISNDVQGIGIPIFDEGTDWGVNGGTLRSVIHFPSIESFIAGPKLHELAHAWGAFVFEGNEDSGLGGHWAYSSANGQLGGFDAANLRFIGPSGTCPQAYGAARTPIDPDPYFSPVGYSSDDMPYSVIELYLMGLADASDLPATTIIAPGATNIDNDVLTFCAPTGLLEYPTRSWLEGRFGPRAPNAFNSQAIRNILVVGVWNSSNATSEDTRFMNFLGCEVQDFVLEGPNKLASDYNFWEATQGLGTLRTPSINDVCPGCAKFFSGDGVPPTPAEVRQQCAVEFPDVY